MPTPLRITREKRGETTRDVARSVGIDQSFYVRIEGGTKIPSPDVANRLAKYFGNAVTRDQILYPEDYVEVPSAPEKKPIRTPLKKAS